MWHWHKEIIRFRALLPVILSRYSCKSLERVYEILPWSRTIWIRTRMSTTVCMLKPIIHSCLTLQNIYILVLREQCILPSHQICKLMFKTSRDIRIQLWMKFFECFCFSSACGTEWLTLPTFCKHQLFQKMYHNYLAGIHCNFSHTHNDIVKN